MFDRFINFLFKFKKMLKNLCRRISTPTFFNRSFEVKELTQILHDDPILTVMLGPPSSGKTALVRHVVEQRNENGPLFHPLRINLRGADINSPDSLYDVLCNSSASFVKRFNDLKPDEIKVKVSL